MKTEGQSSITPDRILQAIQMRYSPFPELSMEVLTQQLNSFRVGELRAMARTWEIMPERDGELLAPMMKRYSDCARLDWETFKDEDDQESQDHEGSIKYFLNQLRATSVLEQDETGGLALLLRQMMTAKGNRYSVHEWIMRIDNAKAKEVSAEFRHCPVWFFESRRGYLGYLRDYGQVYGDRLTPGDWLAAVGEGLMRPCSIAYAIKHFPLRDAMVYCSRLGIPGIQGLTDAPKDSPEWVAFVEALTAFANDWITVTNRGAEIKFLEVSKGAGELPFWKLIEMTNQLYSKLFRGSDLATGSAKGGVGASLQISELNIFVQDDATWATDIINERIVRPLISYLYGTAPKAWMRLMPPKPDTTDRDVTTMNALNVAGVKIGVKTARERLGWPAPEEGEEVLQIPSVTPPNPSGDPMETMVKQRMGLANSGRVKVKSEQSGLVAAALAKDLQPFISALDARMDSILAIADPALRSAKFQSVWDELAPLRKDIGADPATALAVEQIMAKGFKEGLTAESAKTAKT